MHNIILLYILIFLTLILLFWEIENKQDIKQIQNILLYDYEIKK